MPITTGAARFFMPIYPILVLAAVRAAMAGLRSSPALNALLIAAMALQAALFTPPYAMLLLDRLRGVPQAWAIRHDARAAMLLNWAGVQRVK